MRLKWLPVYGTENLLPLVLFELIPHLQRL
jgi:hypothetical protein